MVSSGGPPSLLRVASLQRNLCRTHMASAEATVMRLARRGDVRAAVAHLVIKEDTACLSPRGGLRDFSLS